MTWPVTERTATEALRGLLVHMGTRVRALGSGALRVTGPTQREIGQLDAYEDMVQYLDRAFPEAKRKEDNERGQW